MKAGKARFLNSISNGLRCPSVMSSPNLDITPATEVNFEHSLSTAAGYHRHSIQPTTWSSITLLRDILNTNLRATDWVTSRKLVSNDWNDSLQTVRTKIASALECIPANADVGPLPSANRVCCMMGGSGHHV